MADLSADARVADFIPDGCIPIGWVAAVKYLDEDGSVGLISAGSEEVTMWEALGMLMYAVENAKRELSNSVSDGFDD